MQLHQTVSNYTVTINEYAYLSIFLYEHYMEAVYTEANKSLNLETREQQE